MTTARNRVLAAGLLTAALAGCRGATDAPAKGDALQQDLDAAAASAAFAPTVRSAAPVRFVSALELGASPDAHAAAPASAPAAARVGTAVRAPTRHTSAAPIVHVRIRYVDAPSAPPAVSAAPAVAAAPAAGAAASTAEGNYSGSFTPGTQVAAAPGAATGTSSRGPERESHGGWGTIFGAVIRGGGVGPDMCDEHDRHRSRPRYPGERGGYGLPGQMIGGSFHGELGGRPSGTVVIPVTEILRGGWRGARVRE